MWSEKGKGHSAENHYKTMSINDICKLPIERITDENCILFLWVTFPCLLEGLKAMKEWGFNYKTCGFTWVKRNKKSDSWFFGLGYWTRANAEICLIGTKGRIKRISKCISQIVDTHIEEHSKKPAVIRDRIVELVGDLPRIELFARQKVNGWDVWGNEVESDIDLINYQTEKRGECNINEKTQEIRNDSKRNLEE